MDEHASAMLPRRDFARQLGLLAATGIVAGAHVPVPVVAAAEEAPRPPALPTLILAQLVQQYPSEHYEDAVLEGILGDIELDLVRGRTLSRVALTNADEPATVFRVVRGDRLPHGAQPVGKPPA